MARLNQIIADDSGDELPDLCDILAKSSNGVAKTPARLEGKEQCKVLGDDERQTAEANPQRRIKQRTKLEAAAFSCSKNYSQRQCASGSLTSIHANPLLPLLPRESSCDPTLNIGKGRNSILVSVRSSPRRTAKASVNYTKFITTSTGGDDTSTEDDESYTDLSGFIVSDSESVKEEGAEVSTQQGSQRSFPKPVQHCGSLAKKSRKESINAQEPEDFVDLTSPGPEKERNDKLGTPSKALLCKLKGVAIEPLDVDEPFATLRFSPPRSRLPYKIDQQRAVTPPSSPSKSRLQSPSKRARIPPTPHRPSIDAFWSQEVINDWNDQYSPTKTPKSNRRNRFVILGDSDEDISPTAAPRKSPPKSPAKRDKATIEKGKLFNNRKHETASTFLAEVDKIITGGQVAQLAESTGGIKIIWSKKLSSTAGRANWRREAVRHRSPSGTISVGDHRHHASIELAEKVIDDEHRLFNVIAHEYCHLANFMISGIKNNPHGKEFKQWASKCTKAFKDRGVEVTTKHSYDISYKYIWVCTETSCGIEYKRHSKSIDPAKHTCGACKSKLLQIQPAPRKGQELGKRSEYQDFVKREYERVKREKPGAGFGEVMAVLGRDFREKKRSEADLNAATKEDHAVESKDTGVDSMLKELGGLSLG